MKPKLDLSWGLSWPHVGGLGACWGILRRCLEDLKAMLSHAKASSPPAQLASPTARTAPNRSAGELELVIGLFHRFGPRYRKIARHVAGRSEDSVRQVLKRRGLLAPRSSPVRRRRPSKAPRWSRSEDRRLLKAFEAVPRHKRGSVSWCKVKAAAGLDRLPHSLRNRLARLAAMEA